MLGLFEKQKNIKFCLIKLIEIVDNRISMELKFFVCVYSENF